ncbi:MAG: hypothetical protein IPF64_17590 [Flavobacteriales bacterium]|nr:hypothetical protein [Flavobacteriales bacterium]
MSRIMKFSYHPATGSDSPDSTTPIRLPSGEFPRVTLTGGSMPNNAQREQRGGHRCTTAGWGGRAPAVPG